MHAKILQQRYYPLQSDLSFSKSEGQQQGSVFSCFED